MYIKVTFYSCEAGYAVNVNARNNFIAHDSFPTSAENIIGKHSDADIFLVGDMCFEESLANEVTKWLRNLDSSILVGDPGRHSFNTTAEKHLHKRNFLIWTCKALICLSL